MSLTALTQAVPHVISETSKVTSFTLAEFPPEDSGFVSSAAPQPRVATTPSMSTIPILRYMVAPKKVYKHWHLTPQVTKSVATVPWLVTPNFLWSPTIYTAPPCPSDALGARARFPSSPESGPPLTAPFSPSAVTDAFRRYVSGTNHAPRSVTNKPINPMRILMGVTNLRPSASVIPLILQITQNPLSFIQAIGFEPQPIASAR